MHVLIVAPTAFFEFHFETDLEIAERHLVAGDRVTVMLCNGDLLACEANATHEAGRCARCIGRGREGISRLSGKPEVVPFLQLTEKDREELRGIKTDWATREEMHDFAVDNFDAGWAAQSTLASLFASPDIDMQGQRDQIRRTILSSVAAYRSVQNFLSREKIDRLYVFNGRYATMRAAMRAAQSRGVPFFIHERGSSFEKFALFENHAPHDLDFFQDEVRKSWERADPDLREMIGTSFYSDRMAGTQSDWISYTAKQETGKLPDTWRDGGKNIVIYCSSSDEIDSLREMVRGQTLYENPYEGIEKILASAKDRPDLKFFVRLHPRSANMPEIATKRLAERRDPNLTVVAADSPISTYAMMRKATRVVSFGSTTGLEATFWGKPSILGYRSYFDTLGSVHIPKSHDQMMQLIVSDETLPADKLGALKYGYFMKTFGMPFRYNRPTGLTGGTFKDRQLKPHVAVRTAGWLLERPGVARRHPPPSPAPRRSKDVGRVAISAGASRRRRRTARAAGGRFDCRSGRSTPCGARALPTMTAWAATSRVTTAPARDESVRADARAADDRRVRADGRAALDAASVRTRPCDHDRARGLRTLVNTADGPTKTSSSSTTPS